MAASESDGGGLVMKSCSSVIVADPVTGSESNEERGCREVSSIK